MRVVALLGGSAFCWDGVLRWVGVWDPPILSGFTHYPHHLVLNSVIDPKRGMYSFWIHTLSPPPDFELSAVRCSICQVDMS